MQLLLKYSIINKQIINHTDLDIRAFSRCECGSSLNIIKKILHVGAESAYLYVRFG